MTEPSNSSELDVEHSDYRAISKLATLSAFLGLLSTAAFAFQYGWVVSCIAIVIGIAAIRRIQYYAPALRGTRIAYAGIALAVVCGVTAVSQQVTHRAIVRNEARQLALTWFENLTNGEPHRAHQLQLFPSFRRTDDDAIWEFYRTDAGAYRELQNMMKRPEIRALLRMPDDVRVRYVDTVEHVTVPNRDTVVDTYAVTFDTEGKPTSVFFRVILDRMVDAETGSANWKMLGYFSGAEAVPDYLKDTSTQAVGDAS